MRGLLPAAIALALAGSARAEAPVWLDCTPALPFYCANIHVGCAGRSRLPAEPFALSLAYEGWLHQKGSPPRALAVLRSDDATVLRIPGTRDWIRIAGEQTENESIGYAHRIYRKGKALMMRGTCSRRP